MIGHRVVLRPRSLVESGDLAFAFVRRHWRKYLRLLAWVLVPAVVGWACERFAGLDPFLSWSLAIIPGLLGSGVFVSLCGELMLREEAEVTRVRDAFVKALPRWTSAFTTALFITMGSILFAYPWAALMPEAVLLEGSRSSDAMKRSGALMKATPGRALGFAITSVCLAALFALGAEACVGALIGLFGFPPGNGPTLASYVGFALSLPYLTTLRFLLYIDCRTRREGWDLQVQMSALVQSASVGVVRDVPKEAA